MVRYAGVGHHVIAVEKEDHSKIILWLKFLIAEPVVYFAAVVPPKIIILSIHLRIFVDRRYRIACYIVGSVIILTAAVTILVAIFQCIPAAYFWEATARGHCLDSAAFFFWASFPNIVTDFLMLALPLPVIVLALSIQNTAQS